MNTGIRIIILTVMLALAVTMATFTIAGFNRPEPRASGSAYLLGELDGRVAVFEGDGSVPPLTVTGIETASLRKRDREMLAAGVPVESKEDLARLLEDLGS